MTGPRPRPVPDEDDVRLPKAPEAERLLLQFQVVHPSCVPDLAGVGFTPALCATRDYREVAQLVSHLHGRGVAPHWHVVQAAINSSDLRLDDPVAFEAFDEGVPHPHLADLKYFVSVLQDRAARRRLVLALTSARSTVADPDIPIGETLAALGPETAGATNSGSEGLPADHLTDGVAVAAEGQALANAGIAYVVRDLVPAYGMCGFLVAYTKVGKTTFGQALAATVASGRCFLDREVQQRRVLVIAAEDPPTYTAWLARHLEVQPGTVTFYRAPVRLDADGLGRIAVTVREGQYGLVLVASWQSVIAGLVRDENDNAGSVVVAERVKAVTRDLGVPWLIDAHSGKGEDQSDDADPTKALRGASSAAGAADFVLSLRYAGSPSSTSRRLSGKGRFVSFGPLLIEYDPQSGGFGCEGDSKTVATEATWDLVLKTGAIREWASEATIAHAIGFKRRWLCTN